MSQKNVAVCWLATCPSNKTGSCSGSAPLLIQRQALCQPHIQIKGCLLLPVYLSDLLVPPTDLCRQPDGNRVSTTFCSTPCVNIHTFFFFFQNESIGIVDCVIFNKTVISIVKTVENCKAVSGHSRGQVPEAVAEGDPCPPCPVPQQPSTAPHCPGEEAAVPAGTHHYRDPATSAATPSPGSARMEQN